MATLLNVVNFVLLLQWSYVAKGLNPSVSLTVEGGVSLVDSHCSGTVTLFCEGMGLSFLRWSYTTTVKTDITLFDTNTNPPASFFPPNPAFKKAELLSVQQTSDPRFANFNSTLTVDLSQLQDQGVSDIICEDPGISDIIPVDIQIIKPTLPEMPIITKVTATYQSGMLNSVTASWKKAEVVCPEFEESLFYKLTLNGLESVYVNQTSCGDIFCMGTMLNVSVQENRNVLFLTSHNNNGPSERYTYPSGIETRSQSFFNCKVDWNDNCLTEVQCEAAGGLNNNPLYTIQFALESEDFSVDGIIIKATINTTLIVPGFNSDNTYYFQFSVPVSDTLEIVDTVQLPSVCGSSHPASNVNVFIIVLIAVLSLIQWIA